MIAKNRKAIHNYEIEERVEAGIQLIGMEVKSIRAGRVNLSDSYASCIDGEIYLHHMHISPYQQGNVAFVEQDPYRKRKLMLHKRQVIRLCSIVEKKQMTLIPLAIYFQKQWVKVELGLCRGRKKYDKRQKIAAKEAKRHIKQVINARKR
jgi:SsrA-binding protein